MIDALTCLSFVAGIFFGCIAVAWSGRSDAKKLKEEIETLTRRLNAQEETTRIACQQSKKYMDLSNILREQLGKSDENLKYFATNLTERWEGATVGVTRQFATAIDQLAAINRLILKQQKRKRRA